MTATRFVVTLVLVTMSVEFLVFQHVMQEDNPTTPNAALVSFPARVVGMAFGRNDLRYPIAEVDILSLHGPYHGVYEVTLDQTAAFTRRLKTGSVVEIMWDFTYGITGWRALVAPNSVYNFDPYYQWMPIVHPNNVCLGCV